MYASVSDQSMRSDLARSSNVSLSVRGHARRQFRCFAEYRSLLKGSTM